MCPLGRAYVVVHVGSAEKQDAIVVRPLNVVDTRAVVGRVRSIENLECRANEFDSGHPFP